MTEPDASQSGDDNIQQNIGEVSGGTVIGQQNIYYGETVPRAFAVSAVFATQAEQIPEQPRKLIGRDALKAEVEALLQGGEKVLLLQGFGGMGKTALAATIAAEWAAEPTPVLWVKAGREVELDALFEGIARAFNAQQVMAQATTVDAKRDLLRQILVQSGASLFIVNDAWEGPTLAPIQQAVPPNLPFLVTSRNKLDVGMIQTVGELDPPQALALLELHAHANYVDDETAKTLCKTLGYHAYALEIAGKTLHVDGITPAELLNAIAAAPHELAVPEDLAADERRRIADLIEVSLNALKARDKFAYTVFLAFGAFFAPTATPELLALFFEGKPEISDDMLAQVRQDNPQLSEVSDEDVRKLIQGYVPKNVDTSPVENALKILARCGLAERVSADDRSIAYYRVHDLAYSYARAQNADEQRHRVVDACLQYTANYNHPNRENFAALRPEIENFMGAATYAYQVDNYVILKNLAHNLYSSEGSAFFDLAGYYTESTLLLTFGVETAHNIRNPDDEGVWLGNLGSAFFSLGRYQRAIDHYQQALAISRETGNRRGEGNQLGNLGNTYTSLGQYDQALDHYQQALAISREIGNRHAEGIHLGNLGGAYYSLGQNQQAIDLLQQALAIHREIVDRHIEGSLLGNLGNVYADLGQHEQALEHYLQALVIDREVGYRRGEGIRLGNLGNAYTSLGHNEQALDHYRQALAISREIADRHAEGRHLNNIGELYETQGNYSRASDYHQQSRAIFVELGVQHMVDLVDRNIAIAQAKMAEGGAEDTPEE